MMTWISVKDRLPENGENVLIATKMGDVREFIYYEASQSWEIYDIYMANDLVTHWQPLPEPPPLPEEEPNNK